MGGSRPGTLEDVEARLGHRFQDRALLVRALTHTSVSSRPDENYQRLEFLGDRVLALKVAEMLYASFPKELEGDLARRLNALVKRETCAEVAEALHLGPAIRMTAGEAQSGGRTKPAILGDVAEAVIAAIYLDGGPEAAAAFVERQWKARLTAAGGAVRDAKTTLQEWAQGRGLPVPTYRVADRAGPDHAPVFVISVAVADREPAEARGSSKREAEQAAARAMLIREKVWKE
jgi:ribonuclease III